MLTYPPFSPHFPRAQWTLPAVLEHHAGLAEAPYISWTDEGRIHSFHETNARVNRLAHGLLSLGIKKGDRVILFLPNCLEYVFAWFALMKIGAIEVAIGNNSKGTFLENQLRISQARMIISTPDLIERLIGFESLMATVSQCAVISLGRELVQPDPPAAFKRIRSFPFEELYSFNEANPGIRLDPKEPCAVLFTSGTTGPSKGVVMSHSQFYFFAESSAQMTSLKRQDVYMTGFPLFHGNAQFMTVYPALIAGARCVLYERFSASDFFGRARRCGATVANLLGATAAFLCSQPPGSDDKSHCLRRIFAAPISPELVPIFAQRFGINEFVNGFGQTEISLPFITPPGRAIPANSVGVALTEWFDIRLGDSETDEEVAEGEVGELMIRPKQPFVIFSEYLGAPEKTVESWRNLWFHTGDALRRDAEGWYYFVDRVKDALRRRGENISSFEVESVIRAHPAVAECAVIAINADEVGGEDEIKACIVLSTDCTLRLAELIDWCDVRMPDYMVPRYVEILSELPRTPSEKVRKKELRDRGLTGQTWDRVANSVKLRGQR
jgi:carnitine-CoA ligase